MLKWTYGAQPSCYLLKDGLNSKAEHRGHKGQEMRHLWDVSCWGRSRKQLWDSRGGGPRSLLELKVLLLKEGRRAIQKVYMRGVSANSTDFVYVTSLQHWTATAEPGGEGSITELLTAQLVLCREKSFHQSYHPETLALIGTSTHLQLFQLSFAFNKEIKH